MDMQETSTQANVLQVWHRCALPFWCGTGVQLVCIHTCATLKSRQCDTGMQAHLYNSYYWCAIFGDKKDIVQK